MWNPEWFMEQEWIVGVYANGKAVWTSEWMNKPTFEKLFLNDDSIRSLQKDGGRTVKVFSRQAAEVTSEFKSYL